MGSRIDFDKFNIGIRALIVSVLIAFGVLAAVSGAWLWLVVVIILAFGSATSQYRLSFYPEQMTVELVRILCTFGDREIISKTGLSHIELGFSDSATEYETIREFRASLIFKDQIHQPFTFLSDTKLEQLVRDVKFLTQEFPLPVHFTDKLVKLKSDFDSLSELVVTSAELKAMPTNESPEY